MLTSKNIATFLFVCLLPLSFSSATFAHGADSTSVHMAHVTPKHTGYISYVNLNDCVDMQTSPFVIVAGNGGGNMNAQCPKERPILYKYRLQEGFGGFISVQGGGGRAYYKCCGVSYRWKS